MLVILLALPETVSAQVAIRAGRGRTPTPAPATAADNAEERRAVPRARSNDGSNADRDARPSADSNQRQNDRRNDRGNDRGSNRQGDRFNGLGPLGLPPVPQQQLPWWEQRRVPSWEQPRTPSWERPSQAEWERQLVNPSRAMTELNRKAREAAKIQRRHNQPTVIYALPPYRYFLPNTVYGYGVESTTYITPAPPNVVATPPAPEVETGFLRLEVEPRHLLQVFVDGLYVGTPADLGDEFELRLGARRIELRAPGYRTLMFDTEIVPDRTIVYRGQLDPMTQVERVEPVEPLEPRRAAPPASRTIYMIPGCYIGNVAPTADMVRPGCDLSKVITRGPQ